MYGLQDKKGNWIVQPKYVLVEGTKDGYFRIFNNNKWGILLPDGREIIPPEYDDCKRACFAINMWNFPCKNYFVVRLGKLYGMADSTNRLIVPVAFAEIGCFSDSAVDAKDAAGNWSFFDLAGKQYRLPGGVVAEPDFIAAHRYRICVEKIIPGRKKPLRTFGIYNEQAQAIIPAEFDFILYTRSPYRVFEVSKNGKYGYYSVNGQKLWDAGLTVLVPRDIDNFLAGLWGKVPARTGKKWGVAGMSPDTVIAFNYDTIIPWPYDKNDYFPPAPAYWLARNKNQWSVFRFDGQRKFENSFDSIIPLSSLQSAAGWMVKQDGKWGVISNSGEWIFKPVFEMMIPVANINIDSLTGGIFAVKEKGKWGAVSPRGFSFVQPEYDTVIALDYNRAFFWSRDNPVLLDLNFSYPATSLYMPFPADSSWNYFYAVEETLRDSLAQLNDAYFYAGLNDEQFNPRYPFSMMLQPAFSPTVIRLVYEKGVDTAGIILHTNPNSRVPGFSAIYLRTGPRNKIVSITSKLVTLSTDKSYSYYRYGDKFPGLLRSDGKVLLEKGHVLDIQLCCRHDHRSSFLVRSHNRQYGILGSDGRLLADTTWKDINSSQRDSLVWLQSGFYSIPPRASCYNSWELVNVFTGKPVTDPANPLLRPVPLDSAAVIAFTCSGAGLMNTAQMNFRITPVFRMLFPLAPGIYAAETCHFNRGIVTSNGKLLADTTWHSVYRTWTRDSVTLNKPHGERFILAMNDTAWRVYDMRKGIVPGDAAEETAILQDATLNSMNSKSWKTLPGDCPFLIMDKGTDAASLESWQRELLFHFIFFENNARDLFRFSRNERYNCRCLSQSWYNDFKPVDNTPDQSGSAWLFYRCNFRNDSCFSVAQFDAFRPYSGEDITQARSHYKTWMLFGSTPQPVTLDSLFTGDGWQSILEDTVAGYLDRNPNVRVSRCGSTKMMMEMLQNNFSVSTEGIYLYPQWEFHNDWTSVDRVVHFIPWETLKPWLRKDVASKLGVQ